MRSPERASRSSVATIVALPSRPACSARRPRSISPATRWRRSGRSGRVQRSTGDTSAWLGTPKGPPWPPSPPPNPTTWRLWSCWPVPLCRAIRFDDLQRALVREGGWGKRSGDRRDEGQVGPGLRHRQGRARRCCCHQEAARALRRVAGRGSRASWRRRAGFDVLAQEVLSPWSRTFAHARSATLSRADQGAGAGDSTASATGRCRRAPTCRR